MPEIHVKCLLIYVQCTFANVLHWTSSTLGSVLHWAGSTLGRARARAALQAAAR